MDLDQTQPPSLFSSQRSVNCHFPPFPSSFIRTLSGNFHRSRCFIIVQTKNVLVRHPSLSSTDPPAPVLENYLNSVDPVTPDPSSLMADPMAFVPFHDPHDDEDNCLKYFDNSNPTLADISYPSDPELVQFDGVPQPRSDTAIGELSDPLDDLVTWGMINEQIVSNASSSTHAGVGPSNWAEEYLLSESLNHDSTSPVPLTPDHFSCWSCNVLREIIHTDGNHTMKLQIHGRLAGVIFHAVSYSQHSPGKIPTGGPQYQVFDFCKQNIENVKNFVLQYCEERRRAGYIMVQDQFAVFYQALCIGLVWDDHKSSNGSFRHVQSPISSQEVFGQMDVPEPENLQEKIPRTPESQSKKNLQTPRSTLAEQRKRAKKMTLADVACYFHLPIEKAAERLDLCATVVKKICRRNGVERWPYRKVRSIDLRILELREQLTTHDAQELGRVQESIEGREKELDTICFGVPRIE